MAHFAHFWLEFELHSALTQCQSHWTETRRNNFLTKWFCFAMPMKMTGVLVCMMPFCYRRWLIKLDGVMRLWWGHCSLKISHLQGQKSQVRVPVLAVGLIIIWQRKQKQTNLSSKPNTWVMTAGTSGISQIFLNSRNFSTKGDHQYWVAISLSLHRLHVTCSGGDNESFACSHSTWVCPVAKFLKSDITVISYWK